MDGVVSTRVGYTGGAIADPTYHHMGDHTEAIEVVYDPAKVSYADLLEVFFDTHDPSWPAFSRQYRSAIWVHDDGERRVAEASVASWEKSHGKAYTAIEDLGVFTAAEDYHQKYRLRSSRRLYGELRAMYPDEDDFVRSTVAARLNGWLAGHGSAAEVQAVIGDLGLSPAAQREVLALVD